MQASAAAESATAVRCRRVLNPVIEPPKATINGVAGDPTSWCDQNGCVDGFRRSPFGLPVAQPPLVVTLPEGARIEGASAFVAGAPDDSHDLEISGTELSGFPDGTVMMSVSLRWEDGGDATSYWAVSFAESSPSAARELQATEARAFWVDGSADGMRHRRS